MIRISTPKRSKGQKDVLELRTDPIPKVRVAFIGLGGRGTQAVDRMTHIEGVEIVAISDVFENKTKSINDTLVNKNIPKALEFYGDALVWRKVVALPDVDLIYITTDWSSHAEIAIEAMEQGKHVAIEVPAAMTMDDIWALINTAEKTQKHCIQLENAIYDSFELTSLNMAQQGLLGEVIHAEGAYIHELKNLWVDDPNHWRAKYNQQHRGDLYPTHGLGPICLALNIHRGDKMNFLVSVDTKSIGHPQKVDNELRYYRSGDHCITMIRTEKGKTMQIQHNITSPRPYSRMYQLTGTKGFINKYPVEGLALDKAELNEDIVADHEKVNVHSFLSDDIRKTLMEKYRHPIVKDIAEKANEFGSRGCMDFIMDYRLIYCLQRGLPLDMDVYDLAEWCCLIPLTEISLDKGSMPVEIPDFTRGGWNKIQGLKFAQ